MNAVRRIVWPIALIASAVAVLVVTEVHVLPGIRQGVAMWFLLVCPGMGYVQFLRLRDVWAEWTLAVALSLSLGAIVALVMLMAHAWSLRGGLAALAAITVIGAALLPFRGEPRPDVAEERSRWQRPPAPGREQARP